MTRSRVEGGERKNADISGRRFAPMQRKIALFFFRAGRKGRAPIRLNAEERKGNHQDSILRHSDYVFKKNQNSPNSQLEGKSQLLEEKKKEHGA